MSSSIRRAEEIPENPMPEEAVVKRPSRTLRCASLCLAGFLGAAPTEDAGGELAEAGHPASVDLSDDLHHRRLAGLFLSNREPVVVSVLAWDSTGAPARVPHEFVRFTLPSGELEVQSNEDGYVVVYLDEEAMSSHVVVTTADETIGIAREFREFPRHPIRLQP